MKFVIDHSVAFLYKYGYYRLVSVAQASRGGSQSVSDRTWGHGGHSWEDRRCCGHHHLRGGERADRGGERRSQWHEIRAGWDWQGFWWGFDEESLWCQGFTRIGRTSWRSWCLPASASTWWTASLCEYPPCSVGIKDEQSSELLFVMTVWRLNDIMVANCHPDEQQLSVITLSQLPGCRDHNYYITTLPPQWAPTAWHGDTAYLAPPAAPVNTKQCRLGHIKINISEILWHQIFPHTACLVSVPSLTPPPSGILDRLGPVAALALSREK